MTMITSTLNIETIQIEGYEKVLKIEDPSTKLKAIISIHDSTLGPALGGVRIYSYQNEEDALKDVLRLSKGMTYKAALANCGLGGGKSVIIADSKNGEKTTELLQSFAEAVDLLQGKYICAEDVGCTTKDVAIIHEKTPYVVGLNHKKSSGDPSVFTAWGTFQGLLSSWNYLTQGRPLEGVRILVQGLGAVGEKLLEWLFWSGAKLFVSDIDREKVESAKIKFGAEAIEPSQVMSFDCDIFAPCAMGGILNKETIPKLKCLLVAGCANNQLMEVEDDRRLKSKGILYAPDFVINAGGLINVTFELQKTGYNPLEARLAVAQIAQRLKAIYEIAKEKNIGTQEAANFMAEEKIKNAVGKRTDGPYFHHQ